LKSLENTPVYVYGCERDEVVPNVYQLIQADYFKNFDANLLTLNKCDTGVPGHWWLPEIPYEQL